MQTSRKEAELVQKTAQAYLKSYVLSVTLGKGPLAFADFLKKGDKSLEGLVADLQVEPEVLLRDMVDRSRLGAYAVTYTEALEASMQDLQVRKDRLDKVLGDQDALVAKYQDILDDAHLDDMEKIMLVALMTTGKLTVEDTEQVNGVLGEYLGSRESAGRGNYDKSVDSIDPAVFDKYPMLRQMLIRSRFNKLVREKGYFADDDQRIDYFIDRIAEARALQVEFAKKSIMHQVYEGVVELFDRISTLSPPNARTRITDPQLKAQKLDEIVELLDLKKIYSQEQLQQLFGKVLDDKVVRGRVAGVAQQGLTMGRSLYEALTVSFPSLHQLIGIASVIDLERLTIADEMGTGKTAIPILALPLIEQKLGLKQGGARALVVAPYAMLSTWEKRIQQYLDVKSPYRSAKVVREYDDLDAIGDARFVIVNYEKLARAKWKPSDVREYMKNAVNDADFERVIEKVVAERSSNLDEAVRKAQLLDGGNEFVKSPEQAMRYLAAVEQVQSARKVAQRLKEVGFDLLVSDESDLARNVDAQRTAEMINLAHNIRWYVELTGTPVPNSQDDLAKTVHLVCGEFSPRGYSAQFSIASFSKYFNDNPALLHATLGPRLLRRKLQETADLKGLRLIKHNMYVSLDGYPEQRDAYIEILREAKSGAQLDLLRKVSIDPQLAGEYYHGPMGKSAKYDALFKRLDVDVKEKRQAIIYSVLRDGVTRRDKLDPSGEILIEQLESRYNQVGRIDGDVVQSERDELVERFSSGDLTIMLLTAQAMGRGVDFSAGQSIYHLDKTYLPDDVDQQNARVYRRGVARDVRAYSFIITDDALQIETANGRVAGSLDQGVAKLHERRRLLAELLLSGASGWTAERKELLMSKNPPLRKYIGG